MRTAKTRMYFHNEASEATINRSGVNTTKEPRVGLAIRVARADAFAKIDKFRDRGSKGGLWERVSPLSCGDCATLEKEFEAATAGSEEGNRSRWSEEMCNRWTGRLLFTFSFMIEHSSIRAFLLPS